MINHSMQYQKIQNIIHADDDDLLREIARNLIIDSRFNDFIYDDLADLIHESYDHDDIPDHIIRDAYNLLCLITLIAHDNRFEFTLLAIEFDLCPLHLIDAPICLDDDNDECAAIRKILY